MKHIQKLRKLILTLGILAGMGMTAYAAEYTSLSVGDVIKVGDSFTLSDNIIEVATGGGNAYMVIAEYGDYPLTLVRANVVEVTDEEGYTESTVTESETGGYYVFRSGRNRYVTNTEWVVSGTTDGLVLDSIGTYQYYSRTDPLYTFSVHEATVAVTGVTLNKTAVTLNANGTETLTATVAPDNATGKTITWSSDNTAVATVNNGVVTAVAEGTENITVTATNGTNDTSDDKQATCTVTVTAEQPVTVTAKADPSTTGTYYATFYDSTTSYVADCEVYYATANADGRFTLEKAEGNVIKAGEGVILKATSETVTLTQTDAAASYDSLLTGSDTETTVENALVLSLGKNGVWFYKYSGTLGANKAYLAQ